MFMGYYCRAIDLKVMDLHSWLRVLHQGSFGETYFMVLLSLSCKTKHSPAETLYIVGLGVVVFGAD